jgi:arsenate reductase (glutaredoxin)
MVRLMITIFHNPRCSKSRDTLALLDTLNAANEPVTVIEYLTTPPTVADLEVLHQQLGGSVRDMIRSNEDPYHDLGLADENLADAALYHAIASHPVLLQRPIVVRQGKAAIGRPPELVGVLFE